MLASFSRRRRPAGQGDAQGGLTGEIERWMRNSTTGSVALAMVEPVAPIPAVHSLDGFTLMVPDLDQAQEFYSAFGLAVDRAGDRLLLRTHGDQHVWADLVQGPRKRLLSIRFGIYEADRAAFVERLADVRDTEKQTQEDGAIWLTAPDGLSVEVAVAPKTSPDAKASFGVPPRHDPHRGAGPRGKAARITPRRLSHISLFTTDLGRAIDFYGNYLGLRLSDRSGGDVAFLHGAHGSEHHMIAFGRSNGTGLHHSSWDVPSVADVGQGAMQMRDAGYARGWGVGRHVLGSNYFHYVRDPWGSYAEYSADMDYIPSGQIWVAGDHPAEDSFYQWGPEPPEDFGTNHEIDGASADSR
jgi:catechol 2,3-dioxygenase